MRVNSSVFLLCLAVLLLLNACSQGGQSEQPIATMHPNIANKLAAPKPMYRDEHFEMVLNIDKTTYKVGEPIVSSATLTYVGEKETTTVWGSSSAKVYFTLTDGQGFDMDAASTSDLVPMELKQGEPIEFPFVKTGGYGSNDPDAEFWKTFYAEPELKLPAGTYLLIAHCNFALTKDVLDSEYNGAVYTTITVEK